MTELYGFDSLYENELTGWLDVPEAVPVLHADNPVSIEEVTAIAEAAMQVSKRLPPNSEPAWVMLDQEAGLFVPRPAPPNQQPATPNQQQHNARAYNLLIRQVSAVKQTLCGFGEVIVYGGGHTWFSGDEPCKQFWRTTTALAGISIYIGLAKLPGDTIEAKCSQWAKNSENFINRVAGFIPREKIVPYFAVEHTGDYPMQPLPQAALALCAWKLFEWQREKKIRTWIAWGAGWDAAAKKHVKWTPNPPWLRTVRAAAGLKD